MDHIKMLRLLSYLLGLLIFPSVQGGIGFHAKDQTSCVLQDAPTQCGSFCLAALNPLFDDSDNIRKRLDEIEAAFRMTTAQGQKDLQAGLDSRFKLAEEQHMAGNSEIKKKLQDFAKSIKELQTKLDAGLDRMEKLGTIKIEADANDELNNQVNTLNATIKVLQSQLNISKGQIKSKEDQLKERDEQIATLKTQIEAIEKTKSELSSQLSELQKTDDNLPDSCPSGSPNGIYQIKLRGLEPFNAPCATSPPGWTVIQRRVDGSENFNRTWNEYKSGFGNVSREFFIGLEKLHRMTEARPHELYIKLGRLDGSTSYAQYDDFSIGSEEEYYKLKNLGKYSGQAGDSLGNSKNQEFSTFDRDNDINSDFNIANTWGAWWHKDLSVSSLNGKYFKKGNGWYGIFWLTWHKKDISLTFVEMMIRPKSL